MFVPADDFNTFSEVNDVTWSPDGKCLASASDDETVKIWTLSSTGTWVCQSTVTVDSGFGGVQSVSFSPMGDMIAAGCYNGKIYFIDAQSGEVKRALNAHSDCVNAVSWSHCGKWLASGGDDKMVYIYDAQTLEVKCPLTGHSNTVLGVCFSPDGSKIASCSIDKTIRMWNAQIGKNIGSTGC